MERKSAVKEAAPLQLKEGEAVLPCSPGGWKVVVPCSAVGCSPTVRMRMGVTVHKILETFNWYNYCATINSGNESIFRSVTKKPTDKHFFVEIILSRCVRCLYNTPWPLDKAHTTRQTTSIRSKLGDIINPPKLSWPRFPKSSFKTLGYEFKRKKFTTQQNFAQRNY